MTAYALPFSSAIAGVAGLLLFFVFFVAMSVWIFRPGAKDKYKNYSKIPFREQEL